MTLLRELFRDQRAGLTVYSPDCTQSRLWGNLDHAIHDATGFQIVRRQWIHHDSHPDTAPFIDAFLAGDLIAVTDMLESLPITSWEHFAIQCGTVSRDRWTTVL